MQTITHFEKNSMRKSYRTTIPLHVVIDNRSYLAVDWSLTGVALTSVESGLAAGERVDASLVLQMEEASITIPVTLRLEYIEGDRYGFSFLNLSEKNRAVLRRFIDLAIEGKIECVDEMLALYRQPELPSTLSQDPLALEADEERALKHSFLRTAWRYLLFALLLFGLLGMLLFHQIRYFYEGSGVVTGNLQKISPFQNGFLERVFVKEGDHVKRGDPLFQIDGSETAYQLDLLQREHAHLQQLAHNAENAAHTIPDNSGLVAALSEQTQRLKQKLDAARRQYKGRLITREKLADIEARYTDAKIKLENAKLQGQIFRQKYGTPKDLHLAQSQNDLKISHLKALLKQYRVLSPLEGKVFEISALPGSYVLQTTPLMKLWTKKEPLIRVDIPDAPLSEISIGTVADVIDATRHQHFTATVVKSGGEAEKGSVWLKPDRTDIVLQPYQRLKVLFRRNFEVW